MQRTVAQKFDIAFALIVLIFSLSTGCGRPETQEQASTQFDETLLYGQAQEEVIQFIKENGQLTCKDLNDCHPSVAMLASLSYHKLKKAHVVSKCTGFIVSSNLLLTNSHCLPADIRRSGASCADRLWFFFPAVARYQNEGPINCQRIIYASDLKDKKRNEDVAVLQLETSVQRPPVQINYGGLQDSQDILLVKVNPDTKDWTKGTQTITRCKSAYQNDMGLNNPFTTLLTYAGCDVVEGNSGSPVLDPAGNQAYAIIQGFFEDPRREVSTNFACVQAPGFLERAIPQSCHE